MNKCISVILSIFFIAMVFSSSGFSAEVEQWSVKPSRNMVLDAEGLPSAFGKNNEIWSVRSRSRYKYATPVVSQGKVFVGGDPLLLGDKDLQQAGMSRIAGSGAVACFDVKTGERLWEMPTRGRDSGDVKNMWWFGGYGVCASFIPDGDKVYVLGSSGDLLCLDVNGMSDGNDGDFQDEAVYFANGTEPFETVKSDWGDILWVYDVAEEHRIQLHDAVAGTPLMDGEYLYIPTGQSVGSKGFHPKQHPAYRAGPEGESVAKDTKVSTTTLPSLVVLNKETRKVVAVDEIDVPFVWHGQWSTPSMGEVDEKKLVFFGDGYGVLHALEALEPGMSGEDGEVATLKTVWSRDCLPHEYRFDGDKMRSFSTAKANEDGVVPPGPSDITAAPVFDDGRIYVGVGRDLNHGMVPGIFHCIDAATGEIIWSNDKVGTTMTTAAVKDGLVYAADSVGNIYCMDAGTGETYWTHDCGSKVYFGSPVLADGRFYVGTQAGKMLVFELGKEKVVQSESKVMSKMVTPTATDGIMILQSNREVAAYRGESTEDVSSEELVQAAEAE